MSKLSNPWVHFFFFLREGRLVLISLSFVGSHFFLFSFFLDAPKHAQNVDLQSIAAEHAKKITGQHTKNCVIWTLCMPVQGEI